MNAAEVHPRRGFKAADYILVWTRDGGICKLCGEPVEPTDISIDHILPHSLGGPHSVENWQLAHKVCNFRKGASVNGIRPRAATVSRDRPLPTESKTKLRRAAARRDRWPPQPATERPPRAKSTAPHSPRVQREPPPAAPPPKPRLVSFDLTPEEYDAAFGLSRLGYESESFLRFCEQTGLDMDDASYVLVRQLVPFTVTGGPYSRSLWLPSRAVDIFLDDHPAAAPWPLSDRPHFIATLDKLIYKRTGEHGVAFAPYTAYHRAHPPTQPTYAHRMLCPGCAKCRPQDAPKPADAAAT